MFPFARGFNSCFAVFRPVIPYFVSTPAVGRGLFLCASFFPMRYGYRGQSSMAQVKTSSFEPPTQCRQADRITRAGIFPSFIRTGHNGQAASSPWQSSTCLLFPSMQSRQNCLIASLGVTCTSLPIYFPIPGPVTLSALPTICWTSHLVA